MKPPITSDVQESPDRRPAGEETTPDERAASAKFFNHTSSIDDYYVEHRQRYRAEGFWRHDPNGAVNG